MCGVVWDGSAFVRSCVRACVRACVRSRSFVCVCICVSVYVYRCAQVCPSVHAFVRACVRVCVRASVSTHERWIEYYVFVFVGISGVTTY